ncbi:Ubiquitin-conjugating enzyme E2 [Sphaerulina musiva]
MSSSRNPTIKRILKEAAELANTPSSDFHAAPLENDLFEWHFTLRGTSQSPYEGGIYHGRIILPPAYPLKPPSFRFVTPSGRFEANREICLSISGHHEETWQPAWGIRTALVAIRSFMDTEAKGQVGGMEASAEVRKRLARQSPKAKCATCGKTNEEIMAEQDEAVKEAGGDAAQKTDVVPEELRLAYREDLGMSGDGSGKQANETAALSSDSSTLQASPAAVNADVRPAQPQPASSSSSSPPPPATAPVAQIAVHTRVAATTQQPLAPPPREEIPAWIDKAIYGILLVLGFMCAHKLFG